MEALGGRRGDDQEALRLIVAMAVWRLLGDVVILESLRLRLHRIGRVHWRAAGVLRSWGAVPLHRDADTLHAPCSHDEALWLGAWLDDDEAIVANLELADASTGHSAVIMPPNTFQLAGLAAPHGTRHPIVQTDARLSIKLRCGPAACAMALRLHAPAAWAGLSGRPAPEALTGPPPPPPRLG